MKTRLKLVLFILLGLVLLTSLLYFLKSNSSTEKTVQIVDYGYSVCTQDIPASDCGSYDVTAQTNDGRKVIYKVAGFSNRNSKLFNEVTSKITDAKERRTQVILKVNNKNEIISVQ